MPPSASRKRKLASATGANADFVSWCETQGAVLDGIRLVEGKDGLSRGFLATRELNPGDCCMSIPHALFLTVEVAESSKVGSLMAAVPNIRIILDIDAERRCWEESLDEEGAIMITRRSVLYAYLIYLRHVAKPGGDVFQPYAASLPASYSTPFSWSEAELGHAALRAETEQL